MDEFPAIEGEGRRGCQEGGWEAPGEVAQFSVRGNAMSA